MGENFYPVKKVTLIINVINYYEWLVIFTYLHSLDHYFK